MGAHARGACHPARIRATHWLGRDDGELLSPLPHHRRERAAFAVARIHEVDPVRGNPNGYRLSKNNQAE